MLSLSIRDLYYWHGTNRVLNGLDLEVESNSLCCIVGPSGAGKTTLLKIIVGQCDASRGSVEWGGKDIKSLGSKERATAMVYQNYALFPHLTVWENVTFGLEDEGLSTVALKQRALDALKMVDAREWAQKRPQELSGGQQQRVA
ncbi:MAG: ATP-binding cassette domain-containing protein, partial [Verrucomicrobia bacterium]|nr:ATP-binding cassette domain-containing protein [Verrucomicrobiota bacterium]